jgi:hypothetical protein
MPNRDEFPTVFARLKQVLRPHVPPLSVATETASDYGVVAGQTATYPDGQPFGVVQIKTNYVSYHLFPVYLFPDLLDGIPEPLRKRMQGKSCFNFTKVDETTMTDLARLTEAGLARYEGEGLV